MTSAWLTLVAMVAAIGGVAAYCSHAMLRGSSTAHDVGSRRRVAGRVAMAAAVLCQLAATGVYCVTQHRTPFATPLGTLGFTAFLVSAAALVLDTLANLPAIAAASGATAAALFAAALTQAGDVAETTPLIRTGIVSAHVVAMLSSFALFGVAFACAAVYLMENRWLKSSSGARTARLVPPLATLDAVASQCVSLGLPLLTVGLLVGIARVYGGGLATSPAQWWLDSRTLASLCVWTIYAAYGYARLAAHWRGVRLQQILIVGFILALAVFALPRGTHSFS